MPTALRRSCPVFEVLKHMFLFMQERDINRLTSESYCKSLHYVTVDSRYRKGFPDHEHYAKDVSGSWQVQRT
jgi:hypothetical protein